jgi:hypothetical protein
LSESKWNNSSSKRTEIVENLKKEQNGSPGRVVYIAVLSTPATAETGAMGREIESRQGIGWQLKK